MSTKDLQRTAYTVECFLNALRLEDGNDRTEVEEALVRWLLDGARHKDDHLIYQDQTVYCYSRGHVTQSFAMPLARQKQTLWCNANKLSSIDGAAFNDNGKLVMLGTAGLMLGMPGLVAAQQDATTAQDERDLLDDIATALYARSDAVFSRDDPAGRAYRAARNGDTDGARKWLA